LPSGFGEAGERGSGGVLPKYGEEIARTTISDDDESADDEDEDDDGGCGGGKTVADENMKSSETSEEKIFEKGANIDERIETESVLWTGSDDAGDVDGIDDNDEDEDEVEAEDEDDDDDDDVDDDAKEFDDDEEEEICCESNTGQGGYAQEVCTPTPH
jgi:hypothetical protein